jgi:hypothetical protein
LKLKFRLRNRVALFFRRCGTFFGFGAANCDDALVFIDGFEGVFCFHFGFCTGFGVFFIGFIDLNGNGFGAFGVLSLNGFAEVARFFFWRTRLDELSGTLLTGGRSLLRRPLRSLDPSMP